MPLKVLCRIKLPYMMRLRDSEIYNANLESCENFNSFIVNFHPNIDSNDAGFYIPELPGNTCSFVEIECVLKIFNHNNYPIIPTAIYNTYELPYNDRMEIFLIIRNKLSKLLKKLEYYTKMFWIEEVPINPISGIIGTRTDFSFLHPDENITFSSRIWSSVLDNFMIDLENEKIKPIDQEILHDINYLTVVNSIWSDYLNKANKALYESEYESFIIYCAIAAESFIKQMVEFTESDEDLVLKKLKDSGKNQMVEVYYKVILKYLYGRNLLDVEPSLYTNLNSIFRLRNAIMHSGELSEAAFKKAGIDGLNFDSCIEMFHKLNKTIRVVLRLIVEAQKERNK